jgi:pyruvate-formate lyase-activating enzyme
MLTPGCEYRLPCFFGTDNRGPRVERVLEIMANEKKLLEPSTEIMAITGSMEFHAVAGWMAEIAGIDPCEVPMTAMHVLQRRKWAREVRDLEEMYRKRGPRRKM